LANQDHPSRWQTFGAALQARGVALAYFFGSQKAAGPRLLDGHPVPAAPLSDLDLGVVFRQHPLDYRQLPQIRKDLEAALAPFFLPLRLHLLLLEEENAHVQYAAAIKGLEAYAADPEFARHYRQKVYALYADWHSWWP
jgi:predicted nucleotidyltransferase